MMENAEEIYHFLEDFSKRKPKVIPQELNDYLLFVARTGDPVYQWPLVKSLFKEKLLNVITDFYETTPGLEIPPCPNVDPFNYDTMKNSLLERLDSFNSAPFTVQRICELLTYPRKQYNRIDKFMRAVEKNILVVSTREPGIQRPAELDNGVPEPMEPLVNGDNSDYTVDVDMQMKDWKVDQNHVSDPQPSSSDTHISVDDIEARLKEKDNIDMQEKPMEYESLTPPELSIGPEETEMKMEEVPLPISADVEPIKEPESISSISEPVKDPLEPDSKVDVEMKVEEKMEKSEDVKEPVVIPEIKVDDVDMTDKRLMEEREQRNMVEEPVVAEEISNVAEKETVTSVPESMDSVKEESHPTLSDESSSDSNTKEEPSKIPEISTSSEESSSSSDNTESYSDSPKPEVTNDVSDEIKTEPAVDEIKKETDTDTSDIKKESDLLKDPEVPPTEIEKIEDTELKKEEPKEIATFESDNYSVADLKSELKEPEVEEQKSEGTTPEVKVGVLVDIEDKADDTPTKPVENIGDSDTKET